MQTLSTPCSDLDVKPDFVKCDESAAEFAARSHHISKPSNDALYSQIIYKTIKMST